MTVEDEDQWFVVYDICECVQAREKDVALISGPCPCKKLKLNDSVAGPCKVETKETCISEKSCGMGTIIKCHNGSSGQHTQYKH